MQNNSCGNINKKCGCEFNIKTVGTCDVSRLDITNIDRKNLNWTEISVPEILSIPTAKPDIENIDQVYVNVILENTHLIETPFAYKQYILNDFFLSLTSITTTLPGLLTALSTATAALIVPLETTLKTTLNTLVTALTPLTAIPGVSALISFINTANASVTSLINNLNNTLTSIITSGNLLLSTIATKPILANDVCSIISVLLNEIATMQTLLSSIIPLITGILNSITAAATAIGNVAVTAAVTIATTALNLLITTTLPPLIAAVNTQLNAILSLLGNVDCNNSSAFVLLPNAEGTCLSGRKVILEGKLKQKIVYTAEVASQSIHSAHYEIPFIAYLIVYANFENAVYAENIQVYDQDTEQVISVNGFLQTSGTNITVNLDEEFDVQSCIEDIYVYQLSPRDIFKNVTLFFKATPKLICE